MKQGALIFDETADRYDICLNSFLQSTQIQSGRNINWFSLIIFVRLIHLH